MEQRQHFAMVRHTEFCQGCAQKILKVFQRAGEGGRYWHQSMNCAYCNSKLPISRLRFEIKDVCSQHVAVCEPCYRTLRDELIRSFAGLVTFVEKQFGVQVADHELVPDNFDSVAKLNRFVQGKLAVKD